MPYRVEENVVFDDTVVVARVHDDRIVDGRDQTIADITGSDLHGPDGGLLGRIHDDEIVDREGGTLSTIDAAQTLFPGAEPRVAAMLSLVADKL